MVSVAVTDPASERIEALYREDGARLWRALVAFRADAELASDAVAEAFAQVLRRGSAVRDPQAWVWRAGFRIAAGELKRNVTTTSSAVPDWGYLDPDVDTELLSALTELPPKQRACIVLFYYADASVREISGRTGMSQLAVKANLSRGRKRLKQILGEDDE